MSNVGSLAAVAGVVRKTKGRGKRDPDESEDDEKPSDKNYQPADDEEEHDSERDAEVSEKEDDEPEEEEEDVDDQEEEKSAKVAASKLYVLRENTLREPSTDAFVFIERQRWQLRRARLLQENQNGRKETRE